MKKCNNHPEKGDTVDWSRWAIEKNCVKRYGKGPFKIIRIDIVGQSCLCTITINDEKLELTLRHFVKIQ